MGIRVNWARKKKVVRKETEGKVLIFVSLTWKCRWFQNGNFFFPRFILHFFVHRRFFHSSANPYSFFGCTHAMLFRMTFACIIFHLNIFIRFEYETILFASYVTSYNFHEIHFFFGSYSVLSSWNRWDSFKYLFEWLKVFFFFAAFKEKTVTKEWFVLEHDILHGHFVLYDIFAKWCWFHVGCLVSFPSTKEIKEKKYRFRNETHGH